MPREAEAMGAANGINAAAGCCAGSPAHPSDRFGCGTALLRHAGIRCSRGCGCLRRVAMFIVVQPPGAIRSTLWERGNQRFENERCSLTAAGMSNYLAGQHKNLLVWALEFRCGGVNT